MKDPSLTVERPLEDSDETLSDDDGRKVEDQEGILTRYFLVKFSFFIA
jgi:hypothetical protein